VANTIEGYGVSERRACRVLGQCRATQRYVVRKEEDRLRHHVIDLSKEYGRYGYKRITALLRQDGWSVNHKRVYRIWREEGLKVIFLNVFGGITRCDDVAKGLVEALKTLKCPVPIVIRMEGTNQEQGLKILKDADLGLTPFPGMQDAAQEVAKIVKGGGA